MVLKINREKLTVSFYDTLEELIENQGFKTSLPIKNYLAELLISFLRQDKLNQAAEFEGALKMGLKPRVIGPGQDPDNKTRLRNLGDYCLFITGYLYDHIRKRGESQVEHYHQVGSSAYNTLGYIFEMTQKERELKKELPFFELSERFKELSLVIWHLNSLGFTDKKIVDYYGKWLETNDGHYASLLNAQGKNINIVKGNKSTH